MAISQHSAASTASAGRSTSMLGIARNEARIKVLEAVARGLVEVHVDVHEAVAGVRFGGKSVGYPPGKKLDLREFGQRSLHVGQRRGEIAGHRRQSQHFCVRFAMLAVKTVNRDVQSRMLITLPFHHVVLRLAEKSVLRAKKGGEAK